MQSELLKSGIMRKILPCLVLLAMMVSLLPANAVYADNEGEGPAKTSFTLNITNKGGAIQQVGTWTYDSTNHTFKDGSENEAPFVKSFTGADVLHYSGQDMYIAPRMAVCTKGILLSDLMTYASTTTGISLDDNTNVFWGVGTGGFTYPYSFLANRYYYPSYIMYHNTGNSAQEFGDTGKTEVPLAFAILSYNQRNTNQDKGWTDPGNVAALGETVPIVTDESSLNYAFSVLTSHVRDATSLRVLMGQRPNVPPEGYDLNLGRWSYYNLDTVTLTPQYLNISSHIMPPGGSLATAVITTDDGYMKAAAGEAVSFTVSDITPGYGVDAVSIVDSNSNAVEVSESGGVYSFTMPNTAVTIHVALKTSTASYTVTFVSNGSTYTTVSASSGSMISAPAEPARTGYTFGGWYTEESCTNAVTFPYAVAGDVTLYARWTPNFTVTFISEGGTYTTITALSGSTINAPLPTRSGYIFDCWCSDAALTTAVSFPYTVTADVTLYARWKTFDFTYTISGSTATITGYSGSGGAVVIPGTINDNGTDYTVTAIGNGNGFYPFKNNTTVTSITIPDTVTTIGGSAFLGNSNGNSNLAMVTFLGNNLTTIGSNAFKYCTQLQSITLSGSLYSLGNSAFNGCSNLISAYFPGSKPTQFAGSVFNNCASGFTLYYNVGQAASWSSYTTYNATPYCVLTMELQDGRIPFIYTPVTGGHIAAPADPTRTGHTFGGWYKEPACANVFDFSTETVTADITLYAKWNANPTYTIAISPAITGGTVAADKTLASAGETVILTVTPAAGMQLAANSLLYTANGGVSYTAITGSSFTMPGVDVTVTANFVASTANPYAWDGSVDVSWYNTTDTLFSLSTPSQLAGLAAIVNGLVNPGTKIIGNAGYIHATGAPSSLTGASTTITYRGDDNFKGKTAKLTADLDMGGIYNSSDQTWSGPNYMPVGGQYMLDVTDQNTILNAPFNGTFDGQGHTVKNIYCNRYTTVGYDWSQAVGLIGRLGVHDDDRNNATLMADNPTVRNVAVTGYIYGRRSVGGIAGKIGKSNKGGIIENCANFATVEGTDSKGTGGITGAGWNGGYIKNCYNAGKVINSYNDGTGGISGTDEVPIINCYNAGAIGAGSKSFAIGFNNGGGSTVNCYWLTGSAPCGSGLAATEVTSDYMKSAAFLAAINGNGRAFVADTTPNINSGFPILRVQTVDTSTLVNITKEADPTRLSYVEGQIFDTTGLAIWANYSDDTREKITDYTISNTASLQTTDTSINISGSREGQSYSYDFTITVIANALESIAVTTPPTNILYAAGECFNPAGLVVKATYTNGLTAVLSTGEYSLNPDTMTALTTVNTKITVSYTFREVSRTADQTITVLASAVPNKNGDYYELYSSDNLRWFANQVNTGFNYAICGRLMNDIDLTGVTWTPIGSGSNRIYTGTFEGSSKTVTLSISGSVSYTGMFGYINGATVQNLTVAGEISGGANTAGIAGYIKGSSIINNCVNNATINSSSYYVGGITGYADTSTITGCVNNGTVNNTNNYIGGITGYCTGTTTVIGCVNNGAVTSTFYNVGGITGYSNSTGAISHCTNTSGIAGTYNVSGIVGNNYSTGPITQCSNAGTVNAASTATSAAYSAGGIAGYVNAAATIDQCCNTGAINGAVMNVGGVIGYLNNASAKLSNSYNTGSVTSTSTSSTAHTGGVAGYTKYSDCTVKNCYNAGLLTVSNDGSFTAGVVGYATGNLNISNNYYLNTTASKGLGNATDNAESKTSAELAALAPALGEYYKPGTVYPILTWQSEPPVISVTGVSLNKNIDVLTVGGTDQLTATITPPNATNNSVTWTSDNTSVATVSSSGLVTGIAVGTAGITVTTGDGGFMASCAVTVNPVSSLGLSPQSQTVIAGETFVVAVSIDTSAAVRGWQLNVNFDASKLTANSVSESDFLSNWAANNAAGTASIQQMAINNTAGTISNIGYSINGPATGGPIGSGTLCTISFTAKQDVTGTAEIGISGAVLSDTALPPQHIQGVYVTGGSVIISAAAPDTLTIDLEAGWNTFSTPIALDPDQDTLNVLLPDDAYDVAYGFDASTQSWELISGVYQMQPCEAIYIKMKSARTLTLTINTILTAPPSKELLSGWNLISLANLESMKANEALTSVYESTGGIRGYSQVISQGVGSQKAWTYARDQTISGTEKGWMQPTEGYWVFMVNPGTLAGFSMTP
jgi:uncharacterized repeat protein (TIGR02543 family)